MENEIVYTELKVDDCHFFKSPHRKQEIRKNKNRKHK